MASVGHAEVAGGFSIADDEHVVLRLKRAEARKMQTGRMPRLIEDNTGRKQAGVSGVAIQPSSESASPRLNDEAIPANRASKEGLCKKLQEYSAARRRLILGDVIRAADYWPGRRCRGHSRQAERRRPLVILARAAFEAGRRTG